MFGTMTLRRHLPLSTRTRWMHRTHILNSKMHVVPLFHCLVDNGVIQNGNVGTLTCRFCSFLCHDIPSNTTCLLQLRFPSGDGLRNVSNCELRQIGVLRNLGFKCSYTNTVRYLRSKTQRETEKKRRAMNKRGVNYYLCQSLRIPREGLQIDFVDFFPV